MHYHYIGGEISGMSINTLVCEWVQVQSANGFSNYYIVCYEDVLDTGTPKRIW